MASTKFYLDCRRSKPGMPSVLKNAIGHKDKTSYISLDARLLPNQWDSLRGKILNHPEKQILTAYIYEVKQTVDSIIIDLTREGRLREMSANEIRDYIVSELNPEKKEEKIDETLFQVRYLKFIETKKESTKETYMHTLNRVKAYIGESIKTLRFEDITLD